MHWSHYNQSTKLLIAIIIKSNNNNNTYIHLYTQFKLNNKILIKMKAKHQYVNNSQSTKSWILWRRLPQQTRTNAQVNPNLRWSAKENHYRKLIIFVLFIDLNESYIVLIYFAKTARMTLRIPTFNFRFEF